MTIKAMKPLPKNKTAEVYYRTALNNEIQKFIDKMLKEIEKNYTTVKVANSSYEDFNNPKNPTITTFERLIKFFKDIWQVSFLTNSEKIINKFVRMAKKQTIKAIKERFLDINISVIPNTKEYEEILKLVVKRNVGLIKNVSSQTINNIENIVSNAMINNQPYTEIYKGLKHQKEIAKNRVKLIADDQIHKFNQALNRLNQQTGGIEYFEWFGIDDNRERPAHMELNGKIFKWGDIPERLPIIQEDKNGIVRGYPGEAVRCRCQGLAYYVDLDEYDPIWLGDNKGYKFIKKRKRQNE